MRDFCYSKPSVSFLNAKNALAELQAKKFYPHFYPQVQVRIFRTKIIMHSFFI